jgi:hypothetical protein
VDVAFSCRPPAERPYRQLVRFGFAVARSHQGVADVLEVTPK